MERPQPRARSTSERLHRSRNVMSPGGYERLPMYAYSSSTTSRLRFSPSTSLSSSSSYASRRNHPPHSPLRRTGHWSLPPIRPRAIFTILRYLIPTSLAILLVGFPLYEPHFQWVQAEIKPVPPLAGCFDTGRISPNHNVTEYVHGRRKTDVQAGMPLRMGLDYYRDVWVDMDSLLTRDLEPWLEHEFITQ
jgi:hypothetical protein